jgi:dihydroorotate dehydrogenase electron transfer subunit
MGKKLISDMTVIENKNLNDKYYILILKSEEPLPEILPGQFLQAEITNSKNTFLRRPLSIHDVDYEANTISLLIQKVGEGTHKLSEIKTGETINIIYPLGNGFSIPEKDKILLIGGGCGIAPLLYLARVLYNKGFKVSTLIGGMSKSDILESEQYEKFGKVYITTVDGSLGEKGLVTDHSILKNNNFDFSKIYTCGPEPMMKAIAKIAKDKNIDCEVSLENLMACGIGACLCCVVDTVNGNKCTCTEGPVFDYKKLKGWS